MAKDTPRKSGRPRFTACSEPLALESFESIEIALGLLAQKDIRLLRDFVALCLRRARNAIKNSIAAHPTFTIPGHTGVFGNWVAPREERHNWGHSEFSSARWFAQYCAHHLQIGKTSQAVDDGCTVSRVVAGVQWSIALIAGDFRTAETARANEGYAHLRYAQRLYSGNHNNA